MWPSTGPWRTNKHLESLQSKVNARNRLLRRLDGSSWGAYTSMLRTGALALVTVPLSMHHQQRGAAPLHTRKQDVALNGNMQIITGCMRPTETTFLPVMAGITPTNIRRVENNCDRQEQLWSSTPPQGITAADAACLQRLVAHCPFSRHAARLSHVNYDPAKAWSDRVDSGPPLIQTACPQPRPVLPRLWQISRANSG